MEALLVAALVLLVVGLLLAAPPLSEALVGVCARRLPRELAFRMREEWVAELGAVSTRPGKLAFALALTLTRRRAFAASEDYMAEVPERSGGFFAVLGGWQAMLILPTIVFAAAAYGASFLVTPVYESHSMILVVPQQVPQDYVRSTVTTRIEDRLGAITQQLLSRTQLERVILDFNLYSEERKGGIMEEIVEKMRGDVTVAPIRGDAFRVGFRSEDPRKAMRITERLASMFIDQSLRDREVLAQGTTQFLESQREDLARSLDKFEQPRSQDDQAPEHGRIVRELEYEVLRDTYRSLLIKIHEAKISANLEQRQIGESFKILDAARLPIRPISPNRLAYTAIGAIAGAALGGMALAGFFNRPRRRPDELTQAV